MHNKAANTLNGQKSTDTSGNSLKITAIVCMVIDHVGAFLMQPIAFAIYSNNINYTVLSNVITSMRVIGRLAFPIFCFLLVQGFLHTSNIKKYILRLAAFAFVSEIPFNLVHNISTNSNADPKFFDFNYQNVFFTLTLGVLCLCVIKYAKFNIALKVAAVFIIAYTAELINTDYGAMGVLTIVMFYVFCSKKYMVYVMTAWLAVGFFAFYIITDVIGGMSFNIVVMSNMYTGVLQGTCAASMALISGYNGQRGVQLPRYLFYVFYPAHLLIICFVAYLF